MNIKEKRYAVCSALAASAVPALLLARGHRVEGVPEVPLVVDDSASSIKKTAKAVELLKQLGAYSDIEKVKASRNARSRRFERTLVGANMRPPRHMLPNAPWPARWVPPPGTRGIRDTARPVPHDSAAVW